MDTQLTASHGPRTIAWRHAAALLVAVVIVVTLSVPAAAASPTACRVQNTTTGKTHTTLQAAVVAARRGDRVTVRGVCIGPTMIDKGLVIEGVEERGRPLLDGDRDGVTLTIRDGVSVKVTDLDIEGGRGRFRKGGPEKPYNWPAGVLNHGNLTLRDVIVRRNHGLGVENTGRLRLNGDSVVGDNWVGGKGINTYHPGIHNAGTLRINGTSTVRNNEGLANGGTLILHGASSVNRITNRGGMTLHDAGRVSWVTNRGALTLDDESRMGSVDNYGTLTMNDASSVSTVYNDLHSSVTLNESSSISAGQVGNRGTLTLNGSASISGGRRTRCGAPSGLCPGLGPTFGGGVNNGGTLVLNDSSSISGNSVKTSGLFSFGGGVYMTSDPSLPEPPSLTMTGSATITANTADKGGGIYAGSGSILNGVVCGPGGNVYGNSPDDCYFEP